MSTSKRKKGKVKVLIATPVHQAPHILSAYLVSLGHLNTSEMEIVYCFIDDNQDEVTSKILAHFAAMESCQIIHSDYTSVDIQKNFSSTEAHWDETLFSKMTNFRNSLLRHTTDQDCDVLFMVDSDLILKPDTLLTLLASEKEIISEIFWTKWTEGSLYLPQVWTYNQYDLIHPKQKEDRQGRLLAFLERLRHPGVYRVGGLGACTVIRRAAIEKGVSYSPIYNITSLRGEDRHFCVRAVAMGIELFVDTHHPALHLYNPSMLDTLYNIVDFFDGSAQQEMLLLARVEDILNTRATPEQLEEYFTASYRESNGKLLRRLLQPKSHRSYITHWKCVEDCTYQIVVTVEEISQPIRLQVTIDEVQSGLISGFQIQR